MARCFVTVWAGAFGRDGDAQRLGDGPGGAAEVQIEQARHTRLNHPSGMKRSEA